MIFLDHINRIKIQEEITEKGRENLRVLMKKMNDLRKENGITFYIPDHEK